jgi:hypothetical protein
MNHFEIDDLVIFSGKDNVGIFLGIRSNANDDNSRVSAFYRFERSYNTVDEVFKESLLLKERLQIAFEQDYFLSGDSLRHQDGRYLPLTILLNPYYSHEGSSFTLFDELLRTGVLEQHEQ